MIGDKGTTLTAFAYSNLKSMKFYISFGWTEDEVSVMDNGRTRTALQQIQIGESGINDATRFMAKIATSAYCGDKSYAITNGQRNSRDTSVKFIREFTDQLKAIEPIHNKCTSGVAKLRGGPIWKAIMNYYTVDPVKAIAFAKTFATDVDECPKKSNKAAQVFRNKLLNNTFGVISKGTRMGKGPLYREAAFACYAHMKGKEYLREESKGKALAALEI